MNHQQELVRRFGNEKTPRPTEQRIPEHVQDDRSVQPQDEENAHRASLDTITASRIAEALQNHDLLVQDHRPLVAKLGRFSTACLIINKMIGTGIFETPETIWRGSGTAGGSLLMWCLGSLIAFAGMTVYLELGLTIPRYNVGGGWRSVPRSGGEKNYVCYKNYTICLNDC